MALKRAVSLFVTIAIVLTLIPLYSFQISALDYPYPSLLDYSDLDSSYINTASSNILPQYPTKYEDMLARAEAIVNYQWVPTEDIDVWNENPYNGSMVFRKGEVITGMPYTLFAYELGVDSLLSLEQYKKIVTDNYSTSKYCTSVSDMRTGPAYGSCCATFISEVFGGSYMNGDNPRYDGVGRIQDSPISNTFIGTVDKIQAGDALSSVSGGHIIWVGDITDTTLTIYEQTPPVARKQTVSKSSVDGNGYLVYDGTTYKTITRSTEINNDDSLYDKLLDSRFAEFLPFKCKMMHGSEVRCYYSMEVSEIGGHIDYGDDCLIQAVYTNGWVKVLVPWENGTTQKRYVPANAFFDYDSISPVKIESTAKYDTYYTEDKTGNPGWIDPGDVVLKLIEQGTMSQIIYPATSNYRCAWLESSINPSVFPVTSVSLNKNSAELKIDETLALIATVTPSEATNKAVTWSSSNTSVANVSDSGIVTAKSSGTATITVKTADGGKTATCIVTIKKAEPPESDVTFTLGDINGDGEIDAADAGLISRYDAGFITLTATQLSAGDVNKDGEVDAADAGLISRYDAGFISSF